MNHKKKKIMVRGAYKNVVISPRKLNFNIICPSATGAVFRL